MQQSSSGSYLDGIPGWQRLGRVDIHSRRPMEALPPHLALNAPANLVPVLSLSWNGYPSSRQQPASAAGGLELDPNWLVV